MVRGEMLDNPTPRAKALPFLSCQEYVAAGAARMDGDLRGVAGEPSWSERIKGLR